jgi:hypothetical protein
MARFRRPRLPAWLFVPVLAAGCTLGERDIDAFQHTATGPDKLRAVLHDVARPPGLRARAALNLLALTRQNLDGRAALFGELEKLDPSTRGAIVPGFKAGLARRMRTRPGEKPSADAVRAKDAGVELFALLQGKERASLGKELLGFMVSDIPLRADAGEYHLEAVVDMLGEDSAQVLLSGLRADLLPRDVLRLARAIHAHAQPALRPSVAERLIDIERAYRSPKHDAVLAAQAGVELGTQGTAHDAQTMLEAQVAARRRSALTGQLMPALGLFADQAVARAYLVGLARRGDVEPEQRRLALSLLKGRVQASEVDGLLELALDERELSELREAALVRAGETGAREALPSLLTVLGDRAHAALRKRAGEFVLDIGGPEMLSVFFRSLPRHWDTQYEKREIDAYSERINRFVPEPQILLLMGERLHSSLWCHRVLALRYFASRGIVDDVWRIRQHLGDVLPVLGEDWPRGYTVGQEAQAALNQALERLHSNAPYLVPRGPAAQ